MDTFWVWWWQLQWSLWNLASIFKSQQWSHLLVGIFVMPSAQNLDKVKNCNTGIHFLCKKTKVLRLKVAWNHLSSWPKWTAITTEQSTARIAEFQHSNTLKFIRLLPKTSDAYTFYMHTLRISLTCLLWHEHLITLHAQKMFRLMIIRKLQKFAQVDFQGSF